MDTPNGYFLMYRKILTAKWAKDVRKLALWFRICGMASHKPYTAEFYGRRVELMTGQLVTSAQRLANLIEINGKPISVKTCQNLIQFFVDNGMIAVTPHPRGSIITVINYAEYQGKELPENVYEFEKKGGQLIGQLTGQLKAAPVAACEGDDGQLIGQLDGQQINKYINNKYKTYLPQTPSADTEGATTGDDEFRERVATVLRGRFAGSQLANLKAHAAALLVAEGFTVRKSQRIANRGDGRQGTIALMVSDDAGHQLAVEFDREWVHDKTVAKLLECRAPLVLLLNKPTGDDEQLGRILAIDAWAPDQPRKTRAPVPQLANPQDYFDAYNEILGDRLPRALAVSAARVKRLNLLVAQLKTQSLEGWRAYLQAFRDDASGFYFGDGDRSWTADIDYLLRDTTLEKVRNGKITR